MSTIDPKITVEFTAKITLTEVELRVLEAMAGYGAEEFLKVFYRELGKSYMQPHERGIRTLFESIGAVVPEHLRRIAAARASLGMRSNEP